PWPERARRHLAQRGEQLLLGRRDQRRLVRGHAGLAQRLARGVVVGRGRVQEVDAAEAVHLEVDEARHRQPAPATAEAHVGDTAVDDLDVAPDELAADERGFDAEPHVTPRSARRTTPPAATSRARASPGASPSSSETIATLTSPSAAARAASAPSSDAPVASV